MSLVSFEFDYCVISVGSNFVGGPLKWPINTCNQVEYTRETRISQIKQQFHSGNSKMKEIAIIGSGLIACEFAGFLSENYAKVRMFIQGNKV
jgi:pyruvate/2-oxoglutarate dehydrogenase complex dihydrolipoamide dehydrogenase (E3) component